MSTDALVDVHTFFRRYPTLRLIESLPTDDVYPPDTCGCYRAQEDTIYLLPRARYRGLADYNLSAFHELVHATGHPSRLNRVAIRAAAMGFPAPRMEWLFEEMTAELGALLLVHETGESQGDPQEQAGQYITSHLLAFPPDQWEHIFDGIYRQAADAARLVLGRNLVKATNI